MAHALMVVAGIITFLTVSSLLRDRQETVQVVVANQELVAGSGIEASSFIAIELHADSQLVGQLATSDDLVNAGQLGRDLAAGEPLLRSDIAPTEEQNTLRTFAIPVWRSTIDGLGLRIGDRVDLIGVDANGTLRFVVSDSAISRLPGSSSVGAFGSESGRESWITVQVSDQGALDLALALRSGDIEVVRSTGAPAIELAAAGGGVAAPSSTNPTAAESDQTDQTDGATS